MLSLRQLTQSVLLPDALGGLASLRQSLSWPILCAVAGLLLLAPSWLARTTRRGWPACSDGHFKDA